MTTSAADLLGDDAMPELIEAIHPLDLASVTVHEAPNVMRQLWGAKTGAMALGSRVFVDPAILRAGGRRLSELMVHELVHSRQWLDGPTFLVTYLGQYLLARLRGANHHVAYYSIGAEIEARSITSEIRKLFDK